MRARVKQNVRERPTRANSSAEKRKRPGLRNRQRGCQAKVKEVGKLRNRDYAADTGATPRQVVRHFLAEVERQMPEIRAAMLNPSLQDTIKRDVLIAKLRKITIARGATPAEASTAAAKIAALETRAGK
jgi:hypothetical protein